MSQIADLWTKNLLSSPKIASLLLSGIASFSCQYEELQVVEPGLQACFCTACGVATDRSWQRLGALFLRNFRWKVVNVPHHCIVTVSVAMLREQSSKESYFLVITTSSRSTYRTSAVLCSRWQLGARPVPSVLIGGLGKTHGI